MISASCSIEPDSRRSERIGLLSSRFSELRESCESAKNRHGQTDKVQLGWIGEYTLFRGLDFRRDDE